MLNNSTLQKILAEKSSQINHLEGICFDVVPIEIMKKRINTKADEKGILPFGEIPPLIDGSKSDLPKDKMKYIDGTIENTVAVMISKSDSVDKYGLFKIQSYDKRLRDYYLVRWFLLLNAVYTTLSKGMAKGLCVNTEGYGRDVIVGSLLYDPSKFSIVCGAGANENKSKMCHENECANNCVGVKMNKKGVYDINIDEVMKYFKSNGSR
ncbi:hypothetical protein COV19_06030 [Candidatus Woesearchaeota archaeon CG10_big_fil_rev_8_21_14_0_10_44_13]|nr:MAG: hypothetical protein COV19_06030 [Candidatus Woesearchaeota archaeon CG10_big_fil_rev_8_21_14_0_10_44_13]